VNGIEANVGRRFVGTSAMKEILDCRRKMELGLVLLLWLLEVKLYSEVFIIEER